MKHWAACTYKVDDAQSTVITRTCYLGAWGDLFLGLRARDLRVLSCDPVQCRSGSLFAMGRDDNNARWLEVGLGVRQPPGSRLSGTGGAGSPERWVTVDRASASLQAGAFKGHHRSRHHIWMYLAYLGVTFRCSVSAERMKASRAPVKGGGFRSWDRGV